MKLSEFTKKHFESRAKCAEALGVSYYQLGNMIHRGVEVAQLKNGDWITLSKHNKVINL